MPKRCKGCHFAQATERHRAQTTQSRQKPPAPHPPAPQAPDPPFRSRGIAKAGPGGRGWELGLPQPPPSLSRLRRSHRTRTTSSIPNQQAHHAAPRGRRTSPACGSCRRPLLSDEKQGVAKSYQTRKSDEYRSMEGVATPRRGPHPPGPQAPDPPFRSRGIAKPGPGGRGWGFGPAQPQPSLVQLNDIATNQKH